MTRSCIQKRSSFLSLRSATVTTVLGAFCFRAVRLREFRFRFTLRSYCTCSQMGKNQIANTENNNRTIITEEYKTKYNKILRDNTSKSIRIWSPSAVGLFESTCCVVSVASHLRFYRNSASRWKMSRDRFLLRFASTGLQLYTYQEYRDRADGEVLHSTGQQYGAVCHLDNNSTQCACSFGGWKGKG